jgi:hypothetical protein
MWETTCASWYPHDSQDHSERSQGQSRPDITPSTMRVLRQQHWQVATRCLLSGEHRDGLRVRVRAPVGERMKGRVLGAGSTRNHVPASKPLTTGFTTQSHK